MKKKIYIALVIIAVLWFSFFIGDNLQDENILDMEHNFSLIEDVDKISNEDSQKQETLLEEIEEASLNTLEQDLIEPLQEEAHQNTLSNSIKTDNTTIQEIDSNVLESSITEHQNDELVLSEANEAPSSSGTIQDIVIPDEQTVLLSVTCKTILNHIEQLNPDKIELVPKDGVILSSTIVSFHEGDTAFDVLKRELIARGIHLEFNYTPMYHSVYIEGINNLYEFDCGNLSGWMYRVNGTILNYASSEYILKPNDVVEFVFTCDLGKDL